MSRSIHLQMSGPGANEQNREELLRWFSELTPEQIYVLSQLDWKEAKIRWDITIKHLSEITAE